MYSLGRRAKHLNFLMIFMERLGFKEFEPPRRQGREVFLDRINRMDRIVFFVKLLQIDQRER